MANAAVFLCVLFFVLCYAGKSSGDRNKSEQIYNIVRKNNGNTAGVNLCDVVASVMVKRADWGASKRRKRIQAKHLADRVLLWHTGSRTCDRIQLSGAKCLECLQNDCAISVVHALQKDDLENGLDDIRYNFLIDEAGVIYEGRGWKVTSQDAARNNNDCLGIALLGDFSNREPSNEAVAAIDSLVSCGIRKKRIWDKAPVTVTPYMSGRSFYEAVVGCRGLCFH